MKNRVITPAVGWSRIRLPLELQLHPVDVFLGLSQQLPAKTSHNIGFIYDLAFLFQPKAFGASYLSLKKQTDQLVARANQIITISESSKSDIIHQYHVDPTSISVCYPGVEKRFLVSQGEAFGKERPYFLFVGSLNKAKNLRLALEAFALFLKKIKKPYDFLLVGGDYWPDPDIDESINRLKLQDRIKKIGYVPDADLPNYYRGATAFLTTAFREGFCLPAAESMACGTPVISVNRGAMKEVVGNGGIIVENCTPDDLSEALFSIATKRKLHDNLSKLARVRGKQFSWKTFAQRVYLLFPTL